MSLLTRAANPPTACKISLYFSADVKPSTSEALGGFFSNVIASGEKQNLYTSSGSLSVSETGGDTEAGMLFSQKIKFTLPSTDALRAQRIDQFKKVKFLTIHLSNGAELLFGRNDAKQNTPPKVKVSSNDKITTVEYTSRSITPLGFVIQSNFVFQDAMMFIFQDGSEFIF